MGVCNCSMFCCTLLYVHFSIAIILMGKRELIALLNLSSWCLVMVERLFLTVPRGCLQFVIVVFPDHAHLLFLKYVYLISRTQYGCGGYLEVTRNIRENVSSPTLRSIHMKYDLNWPSISVKMFENVNKGWTNERQ